MNEPNPAAGQVEPIPPQEPPPEPEPQLSIQEHEAQFGPHRETTDDEPPAHVEPSHHSAEQRREKETGKFTEGRRRHRAASQQATAADAPRIQELTRKNKELQAQIDAARQAPPAPAQATQPQAPLQRQPPPANAAQSQPQAAAQAIQRASDPKDPEPQETDEKYTKDANGPLKYFQDWSRWNVRDEHRQVVARQQQAAAVERRSISWGERVEAAMKERPDYAQVAFQPVPWLADSTIDKFIDQDDNGAILLYHLNSNPQDRDALLRMTEFQQTKFLSLLSQRFDPASAPQPSAQAGTTGSVARQTVRFLPPKPPNPVRTEAQRGDGASPSMGGSSSLAEHEKQFGRSR